MPTRSSASIAVAAERDVVDRVLVVPGSHRGVRGVAPQHPQPGPLRDRHVPAVRGDVRREVEGDVREPGEQRLGVAGRGLVELSHPVLVGREPGADLSGRQVEQRDVGDRGGRGRV